MPISSTRAVSTKTVIILLEGQRNMQWVTLPNVNRTHNIRCRDFIGQSTTLQALHHVTFTVISTSSSDQGLRDIVHMSPNLSNIHIRLSSAGTEGYYRLPAAILLDHLGRPCMLSMVTRLTLEGCQFSYRGSILSNVSFPTLRALAIVHCTNEENVFNGLAATQCPQLKALMVKGSTTVMTRYRDAFLKGLQSLRELILDGDETNFDDALTLSQHANTLELLSIHRGGGDRQSSVFLGGEQDRIQALSSLEALRHLSMYVGTSGFFLNKDRNIRAYDSSGILSGSMDVLAAYDHLHSLHLRCDAFVHTNKALSQRDMAELQAHGTYEDSLADKILEMLDERSPDFISGHPMEYFAVTNYCVITKADRSADFQIGTLPAPQSAKQLLSLKPNLAHKPASQVKEEMMKRYQDDGYYFLEEFIDTMMERGSYQMVDY